MNKWFRKNITNKIISIIIWSMVSQSIALASPAKTARLDQKQMLSPAINPDPAILQAAYQKIAEKTGGLKKQAEAADDISAAADILRGSGQDSVVEHIVSDVQAAIADMKYADELKIGVEALSTLPPNQVDYKQVSKIVSEATGKAKHVLALRRKALSDLEALDGLDAAKRQAKDKIEAVAYLFKTKAHYFLCEAFRENTSSKAVKMFIVELGKAEESIEQAYILSSETWGFSEYKLMGDIYAFKVGLPNSTIEDSEDAYKKMHEYYKQAEARIPSLGDDILSRDMVDSMFFTYFTVLNVLANKYEAAGKLSNAVLYYDAALKQFEEN